LHPGGSEGKQCFDTCAESPGGAFVTASGGKPANDSIMAKFDPPMFDRALLTSAVSIPWLKESHNSPRKKDGLSCLKSDAVITVKWLTVIEAIVDDRVRYAVGKGGADVNVIVFESRLSLDQFGSDVVLASLAQVRWRW
jgi:hypothetical protein